MPRVSVITQDVYDYIEENLDVDPIILRGRMYNEGLIPNRFQPSDSTINNIKSQIRNARGNYYDKYGYGADARGSKRKSREQATERATRNSESRSRGTARRTVGVESDYHEYIYGNQYENDYEALRAERRLKEIREQEEKRREARFRAERAAMERDQREREERERQKRYREIQRERESEESRRRALEEWDAVNEQVRNGGSSRTSGSPVRETVYNTSGYDYSSARADYDREMENWEKKNRSNSRERQTYRVRPRSSDGANWIKIFSKVLAIAIWVGGYFCFRGGHTVWAIIIFIVGLLLMFAD